MELARDWRTEVAAAIGRSTHVLALVGPTWMAGVDQQGLRDGHNDPIVFELVEAAKTGRTVAPVLLAGQRMPSAHRLPAPLQWLASLHAAHVRVESADADIAALVNGLPQPPRRPVAAPPQRPDPAPGPRRRGRARLCWRTDLGWLAPLPLRMKKIMGVVGVSWRLRTRASGQMEITTNPRPIDV